MTTGLVDPRRLSLFALFAKFLRFGMLAFGGPVAQIAMVREALVEDERWIDRARFNRLLAVMQVLPGPEAHELCVHLGMIARGRLGGLLAGLGFMLPGLILMLACGWLYVNFLAGVGDLSGLLLGVQVVVLAIILRAIVRIGQHAIEDRTLAAIAAASAATTLLGVPFWLPLVTGGLAYAVSARRLALLGIVALAIGIAVVAASLGRPTTVAADAAPVTLAALFVAGLKGGLLTFGGAYTAIPYVRADTVGRGWLSDGAFLDGVAIAGVLPAPLVIFATFAGYVAGGFWGALAVTAGMFLPAFAFSLVLFERLEALVEMPALHRLLIGVAAAVVGVIAATLIDLARATALRIEAWPIALALFALALLATWRLRGAWVAPAVILGGALAGWLTGLR
ncbi:chromate efflux transporter [Sphingomonas baiyangensis]|uniref:Chromate efflux transporter n=1 Tax=Sphingomonas baiyangensis TaxID=2572576 RepID=A0A4U1L291_9SPHN|nr:chromate efflux transporter [Sphingomonas baiyangensis]TKD50987.1 chromate efflux transporter [Sphingomonas baiyangensis]